MIFNQASTIVAVSMLAMRKDENLFKSNLYVFFSLTFILLLLLVHNFLEIILYHQK